MIGREEEVGDRSVRDGREVFDDARGQKGRMVLSNEGDISVLPSGEIVTSLTHPPCPLSVCRSPHRTWPRKETHRLYRIRNSWDFGSVFISSPSQTP